MEIDEKNLSKHIASISCVDDLSGLTMKQARAVAMLMEHERLKALEDTECKHLMRRHDKCVECGKIVSAFSQLHHY